MLNLLKKISKLSKKRIRGLRAGKNKIPILGDKPGKPRLVIRIRFEVFWPKNAKKPETDWDDKPGNPGLSSQSVLG